MNSISPTVRVRVATPAAWFLLPLSDPLVRDPDADDHPPRYGGEPHGGWRAVGAAVLAAHDQMQDQVDDPLEGSTSVDGPGRCLTREQRWIISTWFCLGEAPQFGVAGDSWINGRHRTWGLKTAGFQYAPVLLTPFSDAIELWQAEPTIYETVDSDWLSNQRTELSDWQDSERAAAWREANPLLADRWTIATDRWADRLRSTV